jgi:signal transduction histidine kinase/streptogramin lyase
LLFYLRLPAVAQVAVDHWTTDNGLPLNTVSAFCQSPEGYLWLATLDGLVRFDGVRFTTYDKSNTEGIEGNRFTWMSCTANGGFWAGTDGSGVTQYYQGRFQTYTVRHGLPSNSINGISTDGGGHLWVQALGYVSRWDPTERRFVPLDHETYRYPGVLRGDGHGIFYKIDQYDLHVFAHGEQLQYPLPGGWPRSAPIMVGADLNRQIWLATGTGKVAELVDGHWSIVSGRSPSRSIPGGMAGFTSDYRDSHGRIWHCENGWDPDGRYVQYVSLPRSEPGKIAFTALFEDREGSIWLATDGQGLYRLREQTIQVISKEQGLADRNTYPIYETRDGAIWIGTWSGGLSRFRDGKFTTYTIANGLASNRVVSIGADSDGVLWVSVEHGLHRMKNERFESASIGDLTSSDVTVRAIHRDPRGALWFGSSEGLIRFEHGQWTALTRKDGLATEDIRVIIDGRDNCLWAGGYGGLSRLQDGQVRAWTEEDGLASNTIRALYEDADGVLWIGTYDGGLSRFEKGRFTRYTVREGLFNNGVFQILEDSRGNFWMSSNRGIYRVSKRQLNDFAAGKTNTIRPIQYGKLDGMRNIECNGGISPAGIKAQDGRLWIPTQDGVAVIDPEKLPDGPLPTPVAIESCLIDRTPVPIDRTVRVTPEHDNLEIQYTALSFLNSEHIRFQYQLRGLDRDWVRAGTRRAAYYPHVPAGSYTFRVAAAHGDGPWNEAGTTLTILVLPPFYQTLWFRFLLAVTVASSVWLGWRHRIRQLERDRAAQQAFSRQLIASQENERKRIAAELHDTLGQRLVVIKNRALLLLRTRDSASSLSESQREQVEEISVEVSEAVREVKEISYDLRPYRLDRLGLTTALRAMIDTASTASATSFSAEIDDIDGAFPKQVEISFYRIVQECLNNILKHSQARAASVHIRRTKERVELIVRDDGRGFALDAIKGAPSGGFGLSGISERAQLLGGKAAIQSAPGQGTTVTVEIDSGR